MTAWPVVASAVAATADTGVTYLNTGSKLPVPPYATLANRFISPTIRFFHDPKSCELALCKAGFEPATSQLLAVRSTR